MSIVNSPIILANRVYVEFSYELAKRLVQKSKLVSLSFHYVDRPCLC